MNGNKAIVILLAAMIFCLHAEGSSSATSDALQSQLLNDIRYLSADDKAGREPDTPGHAKAANYLRHRYQALSLQPLQYNYFHAFTFTQHMKEKRGTNVIGMIAGTSQPEEFILFTAHYDHLGRKGHRIYNGADDNASGVAVLLAIAGHFKTSAPHHSLLFVATDAEESGLHGAKALLDDPTIENNKIRLNINLDMLGNGGRKQILFILAHGITGNMKDHLAAIPQLETLAVRLSTNPRRIYQESGNRHYRQNWRQASDHGAFDNVGIPYIFVASDVHSHYHKASDDIEIITPKFVADAARAGIRVAEYADKNAARLVLQPQGH